MSQVRFLPRAPQDVVLRVMLVVYGTARVTEGGAAEMLQRLAYTYIGPDVVFPGIPDPPPGFITRITPQRLGGVGPWNPLSS